MQVNELFSGGSYTSYNIVLQKDVKSSQTSQIPIANQDYGSFHQTALQSAENIAPPEPETAPLQFAVSTEELSIRTTSI